MVNIDNLFKMISEKGINQSKLAKNTSISTGNISDWKNGKSMPSAVKLDELANYFDCSVDYLLGRVKNPNSYSTNNVNIPISETSATLELDPTTQVLVEHFNKLSPQDKIDILNLVLKKAG